MVCSTSRCTELVLSVFPFRSSCVCVEGCVCVLKGVFTPCCTLAVLLTQLQWHQLQWHRPVTGEGEEEKGHMYTCHTHSHDPRTCRKAVGLSWNSSTATSPMTNSCAWGREHLFACVRDECKHVCVLRGECKPVHTHNRLCASPSHGASVSGAAAHRPGRRRCM